MASKRFGWARRQIVTRGGPTVLVMLTAVASRIRTAVVLDVIALSRGPLTSWSLTRAG